MKEKLEELLKMMKGEKAKVNVKEQMLKFINNSEEPECCILATDEGLCLVGSGADLVYLLAITINHLKKEGASEELINEAVRLGLASDEDIKKEAKEKIKDLVEKILED